MSTETAVPPAVLWAQRKEDVFLTFSIESKDPNIKIEKESVYFKGVNAQDNKVHEVTIPLYDAVVPETSAFVNKGRCIEMILRKEKKDASYWPSLTKDKKKPHYLKIDFNKWTDEDDVEEDGKSNNYDIEEMLRSMGGAGAGAGDLAAAKPSFDDLEEDSDDENLPDLE
ncbi:P23-like protein [Operophtera brumata]|uniref:p23-like protein n=1 Tax=Operophtera brumata TaxID=104452 RepID=A0A0L7L772_OPEBR|nr:P23-like protein [Operophtera brumata]